MPCTLKHRLYTRAHYSWTQLFNSFSKIISLTLTFPLSQFPRQELVVMSMKIFNWVQRRFHHGTIKDGLAGNVKKAESITKEADKQALLKQVALVDVLDGWKDGILTIGTLGLDPLIPFNQQNDQYFILESDEEGQEEEEDEGKEEEREIEQYSVDDDYYYDDNVEDEEVNPLVYTTFDHSFEEIGSDSLHYDVITNSTTIAEHEQRKNKGERITLAELFLEDSDMKRKPDSVEVETEPGNKKPVARAKSGLSFAKKLIRPHVVEDSRPIKKFNQLMRRMLKRKIHPEFDWKGNKTDNQNKSGIMDVHISKGNK